MFFLISKHTHTYDKINIILFFHHHPYINFLLPIVIINYSVSTSSFPPKNHLLFTLCIGKNSKKIHTPSHSKHEKTK